MTYRDLVQNYIAYYRPRRAAERADFRGCRNLRHAVHEATLPNGKCHVHQRRVGKKKLQLASRRLLDNLTQLRAARTFDELHAAVKNIISSDGVGKLASYDVADRLGMYLRLEPKLVYLHAGTLRGARSMGLQGPGPLKKSQLPKELWSLTPAEREDFFCIYGPAFGKRRSRAGGITPRRLGFRCAVPSACRPRADVRASCP